MPLPKRLVLAVLNTVLQKTVYFLGEKGEKGKRGKSQSFGYYRPRCNAQGTRGKDGFPGANGMNGHNGHPGTKGEKGISGLGYKDISATDTKHCISSRTKGSER